MEVLMRRDQEASDQQSECNTGRISEEEAEGLENGELPEQQANPGTRKRRAP